MQYVHQNKYYSYKSKPFRRYFRWFAGLVIIAFLASVVILTTRYASSPPSSRPIEKKSDSSLDLLSGQDWSHFTGATQAKNNVYVTGLGREIVNQDGTSNQDNPPVNVRGPHLQFKGKLALNADIRQIPESGTASLYLYGAVPVIYDEWRYQTPQLRIDISRKSLALSTWNGQSDSPNSKKEWQVPVGPSGRAVVNIGENNISASVNGRHIGQISPGNIFSGGHMWFGADATVGQRWLLHSLSVSPAANTDIQLVPGLQLKLNHQQSGSLRGLALANPRHLPIGAAIANYALFSDPGYQKIVAIQFSMLTPENELKAQFIEPQPGVFSFTEADSLVDFALANGMAVHGHNLVFSEANPIWMQKSPVANRRQILQDHITAEVKHFGSRINEWDVVNEPLKDNDDNFQNSNDLRRNIWFASMGESYIDIALKTARTANPSAKLYINEYGLEADGDRWEEFLALIHRLQSRKVPLDGVGFQAHVYERGDEVDSAVLVKHINKLASLGLVSRISEVDVHGDDQARQASQYAGLLQACLGSPSCTSFSTWGVTDRYGSTTDLHTYPLEFGDDLIWDSNLKNKPTYHSLQAALEHR